MTPDPQPTAHLKPRPHEYIVIGREIATNVFASQCLSLSIAAAEVDPLVIINL